MSKIKLLTILIVIVIVISSFVYIARKDAISIAIKAQGKGSYVATKTEIVWFKLSPYWSISLEGDDGDKKTLMIDPFFREVFAEAGY